MKDTLEHLDLSGSYDMGAESVTLCASDAPWCGNCVILGGGGVS